MVCTGIGNRRQRSAETAHGRYFFIFCGILEMHINNKYFLIGVSGCEVDLETCEIFLLQVYCTDFWLFVLVALQDPLAIIGIVSIFFPFVILGVAIALGYVDLNGGRWPSPRSRTALIFELFSCLNPDLNGGEAFFVGILLPEKLLMYRKFERPLWCPRSNWEMGKEAP